jgi:hypothetical protein
MKKADAKDSAKAAVVHVGLLFAGSPGVAELPFI